MSKTPKLRFKEFSGDWESKKLGNICEVTMGQSPSSSCYNEDMIGMPLIQGNADVKCRKTAPRIYTSDITKTCDVGDIIMSVRAPVGAISKSIHKACIGRGVCSIKPKQNNEFIYQFLLKYEDKWGRISQGSTFESVNRTDITETKVTIPSLEEQEKIASFFSLIDDNISLQSEKVEALRDYKKGMMQKIFGRELRFKDDEGRDYPEWEEYKFKEIIKEARLGGNYGNSEKANNYPLIKMGNIGRGNIELSKIEYINSSEILNDEDILKQGDLLFNTRNTLDLVGKVAIWNNELDLAYYNSNLLRLTFKEEYVSNNNFMNYLFNSYKILKKLKSLATGTTSVAAIYMRDLENIRFKLPSKNEQCKIANLLLTIDEKIKKEQEKLDSLKQYKKGLLQQMFV